MDEHDGALPLNVEYRAFQQMCGTLHIGIQAGLSDVVNEVFAKGLICSSTKSVADNASIGEPSRASTLLNSMLHRTKICPKTFTLFAEALDSIPSFQYLSTDMRSNLTALEEQEAKRRRELQQETEKQERKRQELQLLRIVQKPKRSEPVHVVAPDSYTSPSGSTVRRIDIPHPQSPIVHDSMKKFNHHNSTPGLDPNSSVVSTPTAKTVRLTPDTTTRPELGYVVAVAVESPGCAVITGQKAALVYPTASYPMPTRASIHGTATAMMMPAPSPSHSAPFTVQHTFSDKQLPLLSSSAPSKIPLSDIAILRDPSTLCVEPCTKQDGKTTSEVPTASVIPPTPSSPEPSIDARIQQQSDFDDSGLNLKIGEIKRSLSAESSSSSCSHDFHSLESNCEVDSEEVTQKRTNATQESDSTHDGTSGKKLHRSVSCEKCLKKMLRKKKKEIDEMEIEKSRVQLDYDLLQAACESKIDKLYKDSSALQNEVYKLTITLQHYGTENNELHQRNSNLLATNTALKDENCQLKDDLKGVKADAYDMTVDLRSERSKSHRCPTCESEFTYRYI